MGGGGGRVKEGGREKRRQVKERKKREGKGEGERWWESNILHTDTQYLDDRRVNGVLYFFVIIGHRLIPDHHDTLAGEGVEEGGLGLHTEWLPGPFHKLLVPH